MNIMRGIRRFALIRSVDFHESAGARDLHRKFGAVAEEGCCPFFVYLGCPLRLK